MRSYPVKESHIGSVVTKILWYTHTDRYPFTLLQELYCAKTKLNNPKNRPKEFMQTVQFIL